MRFLAVALILSLSSFASFGAGNCSSVDLRNTPKGRVLGEVRNQGNLPWCSAYALSDFVSFFDGQRISSLGVALSYFNRYQGEAVRNERRRNNSTPHIADMGSYVVSDYYDHVRSKFQCLETDLPSNNNRPVSFVASLNRINEIKRDFERTRVCAPGSISEIRSIFPRLQQDQIMRILNHSLLQDFGLNLMRSNCKDTKISVTKREINSTRNWATLRNEISQGRPVMLSYKADVLRNPSSNREGGGHMSLVVGRRMRAGRCEYLIRNSWGRSCNYYHSSYACEAGNVWIPEDSLQRNAGLIYSAR